MSSPMICLALAFLLAAAQGEFDRYLQTIAKRVEAAWKYPPKSDNLQATVTFTLDRAGRVTGLKLKKPSGRKPFDDSVLEAVRAATPFPPLLTLFKRSEEREVQMSFQGKKVRAEGLASSRKDPQSSITPAPPTVDEWPGPNLS